MSSPDELQNGWIYECAGERASFPYEQRGKMFYCRLKLIRNGQSSVPTEPGVLHQGKMADAGGSSGCTEPGTKRSNSSVQERIDSLLSGQRKYFRGRNCLF